MVKEFSHRPVMLDEVTAVFDGVDDGLVLDGTLGGGGHSEGILHRTPGCFVLGIDRDASAVSAASRRLAGFAGRFLALKETFDNFERALTLACSEDGNFCRPLQGFFLDLGVSSHQLDTAERGFSYRLEGPLDMRMDPSEGVALDQYLDSASAGELARVFRQNGESRFARRIAEAVLAHRPYRNTVELSDVIKNAIPAAARRTGGHPATRVFQALRIEINGELEKLRSALDRSFKVVASGGRVAVISYHSGEDSIVKSMFREQITGGCTCPVRYGCVCGAVPKAKSVVRSKTPAAGEIAANPRSRSARLRAIEILDSQI